VTSGDLELVRELQSDICHCGSDKKPNTTFCTKCYFRLPHGMRQALYRRLGDGYADAVQEAKDFLR
jgi:hypothetical protein